MARSSTGQYPPNWRELARAIKEQAGWRCVRCDHPHDPATGHTLTVHHLDLNPANNAWWNTPALCQRCHLSIQNRVVLDRGWLLPHSRWFRPYVAGYYAHRLGYPEDRGTVLGLIDLLIAKGQGQL